MAQELSEFLAYRLYQAAEVTSRNFQKVYKGRYGMLRTEWRVLFNLGSFGDQTAKQISERASLHKTKVSRAVNALEAKRFLKRQTLEHDRRSEMISLTKTGQLALRDLTAIAADYDRQLVQALGDKQYQALVESLDKLLETGPSH